VVALLTELYYKYFVVSIKNLYNKAVLQNTGQNFFGQLEYILIRLPQQTGGFSTAILIKSSDRDLVPSVVTDSMQQGPSEANSHRLIKIFPTICEN
jgi:hypothetical protein